VKTQSSGIIAIQVSHEAVCMPRSTSPQSQFESFSRANVSDEGRLKRQAERFAGANQHGLLPGEIMGVLMYVYVTFFLVVGLLIVSIVTPSESTPVRGKRA